MPHHSQSEPKYVAALHGFTAVLHDIHGSEMKFATRLRTDHEITIQLLDQAGRRLFALGLLSVDEFLNKLNRTCSKSRLISGFVAFSAAELAILWTSTYVLNKPVCAALRSFVYTRRSERPRRIVAFTRGNQIDRLWMKVHGVVDLFGEDHFYMASQFNDPVDGYGFRWLARRVIGCSHEGTDESVLSCRHQLSRFQREILNRQTDVRDFGLSSPQIIFFDSSHVMVETARNLGLEARHWLSNGELVEKFGSEQVDGSDRNKVTRDTTATFAALSELEEAFGINPGHCTLMV